MSQANKVMVSYDEIKRTV